jgi:hypothetical protein
MQANQIISFEDLESLKSQIGVLQESFTSADRENKTQKRREMVENHLLNFDDCEHSSKFY